MSMFGKFSEKSQKAILFAQQEACLLYTSDAADEAYDV